MINEVITSQAIAENYYQDFLESLEVDFAVAGGGPAGMTVAYYLAKAGKKTVVFERELRVGEGMPWRRNDDES